MTTHMTQEREPWIDTVVDAFDRIDMPEQPADQELIGQLLAADAEPVAGGTFKIWHYMRHATVRRFAYAAAAVLLIAAVLTGVFLPGGVSPQQAFAQMIENVANIRTAIIDMVVTGPDQEPFETRIYLKNPGWMRQEMGNVPTIQVYDLRGGKMLTLQTFNKQASITDLSTMPADRHPFQIVEAFQEIPVDQTVLVEELTENGVDLLVYDYEESGLQMRIWVDKATFLPVRTLVTTRVAGQDEPVKMLMKHMAWDAPVDDSMFSLVPPQGYVMRETDLGQPGNEDLVRLLRLWTVLTDGAFPEELHPMNLYQVQSLFNQFEQRRVEAGVEPDVAYAALARALGIDTQRLDEQQGLDLNNKIHGCIGRGAAFMANALSTGTWVWTGSGAQLGDEDRIVCYWQGTDGGYYSLDAELNIEQIDAEAVPRNPSE